MKQIYFMALIGLSALILSSCEQPTPTPTPDPHDTIPASFPKKHLIEEFTGQDCGYCPYGMDCIREFVGNDTNWVLVLHHYGYAKDHFSIDGSKEITSRMSVSGAPNMSINRSKTNYDGKNSSQNFHPGYLEYTSKEQFDNETYASVVIDNSYDAATRELQINISGAVCRTDVSLLNLTVMVKESGMIDYQKDYYDTFEGWQEFRHANAVRAILTDVEGDLAVVNKQRYSAQYTVTLDANWVPENCMVVAFLSEDFKPVIQAEQKPVVSGTKGGADISHGGVTRVPVPDYYPEPSATKGPADYSGVAAESFLVAYAQYKAYPTYGINYWQLTAYDESNTVSIDNTDCIRFAYLYLVTSTSQKSLAEGSYPVNNTLEPGTVYAGYRDDEECIIDGSTFYFVDKAYFDANRLRPMAEWLIADGTMEITATGWELNGHARNGAEIHLVGTSAIANAGPMSAPARAPKKTQNKEHAIEYCK